MTTIFDPQQKPSPLRCPHHFCFSWHEANTYAAPGTYTSLEAALAAAEFVSEAGCGCSFGRCLRLDFEPGDKDWYEPHEPALERAGLPWFYFIPAPHMLVEELQPTYIDESERLWGREHWVQEGS